MTKKCCVCFHYQRKGNPRSFHKFPRNLELRKKWFDILQIPRRADISIHNYICSDHFEDYDFRNTPTGIRYLNSGAVPTISIKRKVFPKAGSDNSGLTIDRTNFSQNVEIAHQQECVYSSEQTEPFVVQNELEDRENACGSDTETASETTDILRCIAETSTISDIGDLSGIRTVHFSEQSHFLAIQENEVKVDMRNDSDTETASETTEILKNNVRIPKISDKADFSESESTSSCTDPSLLTVEVSEDGSTTKPSFSFNTKRRKSKRRILTKHGTHLKHSHPKEARKRWKLITETVSSLRTKIRALQQTRRRLKSRVACLTSLLNFIAKNSEATI